jgi:hypothetical protein
MENSDRLLKKIWLVNGFILLALGVLALSAVLFVWLTELLPRSEPAVRVAAESAAPRAAPRAIRYGAPVAVRGTTTRLVTVHHGKADQPEEPQAYGVSGGNLSGRGGYYGQDGPLVNVIFLTPGVPQGRLLLDRPAYISGLDYPAVEEDGVRMVVPGGLIGQDSLQTWITYEIVDRDTNGDGKLSAADQVALHVSALDGTGLRRVLPEPFRLLSHATAPDRRGIVILALEPPKGVKNPEAEQMRQRAFVYDLASGRLLPYAALEAAADRAARIVGR